MTLIINNGLQGSCKEYTANWVEEDDIMLSEVSQKKTKTRWPN